MTYRGLEYKLLRNLAAGMIFWSFRPTDSVTIRGQARNLISGRLAAENAIKQWLKENQSKR
jgi:hypothetical protein